ncbi:MAG: hypothetical protein IPN42_19590, partial [Methylococcaceae bacterium]|nr:hypothetical protein [Methylococcaceae bacterium]
AIKLSKDLTELCRRNSLIQQDYSNNPNAILGEICAGGQSRNYTVGETLENVGLKYTYERLEGDGDVQHFQTWLGD